MKRNTKQFIEKSIEKHKNKYDYSKVNYIDSSKKVEIICKEHGSFWQIANDHIRGRGCSKCHLKTIRQKPLTQQEFIKKCKEIHGDEYIYDKAIYVKNNKKVTITCKIHGDFEQYPNTHTSQKSGCPNCYGRSGFSKKRWIEYCNNKKGIFYTIKCWNETEKFYKIGITSSSIKERYNHKTKMPYNYKILKEIKSTDLNYIWDLEKKEKNRLKIYKYSPKIKFAGYKECFTIF